jgi:hypothetical protein
MLSKQKPKGWVDFRKVKMSDSNQMWTDDMSRSSFIFDAGTKSESGSKSSTKVLTLNSEKSPSRTSRFANKFR